MKALSIKQPWAWLIAHGYKDIENRDWPTKHRGEFLIHASKGFDDEGLAYVLEHCPDIAFVPKKNEFPRGGIVGKAEIVDCVAAHDSRWFFGDFGFVLKNAQPLMFYPCKGQLSFFEVTL